MFALWGRVIVDRISRRIGKASWKVTVRKRFILKHFGLLYEFWFQNNEVSVGLKKILYNVKPEMKYLTWSGMMHMSLKMFCYIFWKFWSQKFDKVPEEDFEVIERFWNKIFKWCPEWNLKEISGAKCLKNSEMKIV